jgi:hypothetical protein
VATPRKPHPPHVAPADSAMSIAAHPRASDAVDRAKGAGGLLGLVLTAALARHAGLPAFDVGLRALIGGVAGYVVFWAIAVQAARHLVLAEARATGRRLEARAHAEGGPGRERQEGQERLAVAASAQHDATRNGTPA